MPQSKTHRSAGGLRAHSRSSSTGSSRLGLNTLQFTQRESTQPTQQQKGKKPVYGITEVRNHKLFLFFTCLIVKLLLSVKIHPSRTHSPAPRGGHLNGHHRPLSKEYLATLQPKRSQTPTRRHPLGAKTDFAIARSDDTEEEDEWVSSESAPATPARHSDDEEAVVIEQPPKTSNTTLINDHIESATPRANNPISLRIEPTQSSSLYNRTTDTSTPELQVSHTRQVRSEAPSPTHKRHSNKRNSLYHDPYIHTERMSEMPRHPLIRGQSYQGPLKPPVLAPLTVNSEAVSGQISASPPHTRSGRSPPSPASLLSPTSMRSPVLSQYAPSTRRTSISSSQSVATLPALTSNIKPTYSKSSRDRLRTISSASSAALTSLSALPTMSRPTTPPFVMHFPPDLTSNASRPSHPLLPQEYVQNHFTMLNSRSLLHESYDRVMRSKGSR